MYVLTYTLFQKERIPALCRTLHSKWILPHILPLLSTNLVGVQCKLMNFNDKSQVIHQNTKKKKNMWTLGIKTVRFVLPYCIVSLYTE